MRNSTWATANEKLVLNIPWSHHKGKYTQASGVQEKRKLELPKWSYISRGFLVRNS